jgi:two-component sensor histidine kinase
MAGASGGRTVDKVVNGRESHLDPAASGLVAILQDVHHRVANSLTVLSAVLRHEFAGLRDDRLEASLRRCDEYIAAIAELNRLLSGGWDDTETSVETHFQALCALLTVSALEPRGVQCEAFIGTGVLRSDKCGYLALIVSELVTNAAKHAFAGRDGGHIRIQVLQCHGVWYCQVSDNGKGIQSPMRGTGSRIIEGLLAALDGHMELHTGPRGTTVTIAFRD